LLETLQYLRLPLDSDFFSSGLRKYEGEKYYYVFAKGSNESAQYILFLINYAFYINMMLAFKFLTHSALVK
jgi:hypothetical protein